MSTTAIQPESVIEATMKATILYDKLDLAAKAKAVLERAMDHAGATTRWIVKPWRVNLLASNVKS